MMIELVMYGMIPSEMTENRVSAPPEHLHRQPVPNQPPVSKDLGADLGPGLERLGQPVHVHHRELPAVRVGEALELRDPALQRHLSALEALLGLVAGLETLRAPAGRLALAGGLATTHPLPVPNSALGRPQMMELHPSSPATSSTFTRWATLAIIPRISGRSSFTTESRRRCSPRARTVAFWSLGRSMALLICVTRNLGGIGFLQARLGPL